MAARVAQEDAAVDRWMKDIAPSTELRQWFGHDPERWHEFRHRYARELQRHATAIDELRELARGMARLRWCLARATKSTTMPSRCARFSCGLLSGDSD